jgi:hypothetical protein
VASLITWGIAVKVKLSFGVPNHNHCDGDSLFGVLVRHVTKFNHPTMDDFKLACKEAIATKNILHEVVDIVGVPDYATLFDGFVDNNDQVKGLFDVLTYRMTASSDGGIDLYTKSDVRFPGYDQKYVSQLKKHYVLIILTCSGRFLRISEA